MHYLLLLFFAVYPIANLISLGAGMGMATITGGLLLVAAPFFLAKNVLFNKEKFHVSTPMLLLILLFLFCAASGFWAYSEPFFQQGIFELGQTMALLLIVDLFVKNNQQNEQLMKAFIFGTLALAAFLFVDFAAGSVYQGAIESFEEERYSLKDSDPNIKAMQMCLGMALLFGHTQISKLLMVNYAAAAVLFTAIVLTGSRTGFIASVAILSIYVLYQGNLKQALWRWAVLIACLLAVYMLWDFQQSEISVDRMEDMLDKGLKTDLAGREGIWVNAADIFSRHMTIGVGYNSFAAYHKDFFGIGLVTHNTHLNFLVELGLLGYLLFWAVYAYAPMGWFKLQDADTKRTYAGVFAALFLCSITLNLAQHFSFWVFLILLDKSVRSASAAKAAKHVNAHRDEHIEKRLQAIRRRASGSSEQTA